VPVTSKVAWTGAGLAVPPPPQPPAARAATAAARSARAIRGNVYPWWTASTL
jgi:hypothetical protein